MEIIRRESVECVGFTAPFVCGVIAASIIGLILYFIYVYFFKPAATVVQDAPEVGYPEPRTSMKQRVTKAITYWERTHDTAPNISQIKARLEFKNVNVIQNGAEIDTILAQGVSENRYSKFYSRYSYNRDR